MKKLPHLVLAIALLCALTALSVSAEESDFVIEAGVLVAYNGSGGDVVIPEGVTSISEKAFSKSKATSITIPGTVSSIGDFAFTGCSRLTDIVIPASVTQIGNCAFNECTNLSNIDVAADNLFYTCQDGILFSKNMTALIKCPSPKSGSYTIPDGVNNIENRAFEHCNQLTDISIPASVTSIGSFAFWGCDFTSIELPGSVTSIGDGAFYFCRKLTGITVPDSVTYLGARVFDSCYNLVQVDLPSNISSIETEAFRDCRSLTHFTVPDGVTCIGDRAFWSCYNLVSITIPVSVVKIKSESFYLCSSFTDIYYTGTLDQWASVNKTYSNNILSTVFLHFISSNGTPGVAGNLGDENELSWEYADGKLTFASPFPEGYMVIVANINNNQQFTGAGVITAENPSAQIGTAAFLKFFWLDSSLTPQCDALTVKP